MRPQPSLFALVAAAATFWLLLAQQQAPGVRVIEPPLPLEPFALYREGQVALTWGSLLRRWTLVMPVPAICNADCNRSREALSKIRSVPGMPENVAVVLIGTGTAHADAYTDSGERRLGAQLARLGPGPIFVVDGLGRVRALLPAPQDAGDLAEEFLAIYRRYKDECCTEEGAMRPTVILGR